MPMLKPLVILWGLLPLSALAAPPDKVIAELHAMIPPVQKAEPVEKKQTLCLALGLYHEARGEADIGRQAVGHVILNRIHQSGQSVCQTIWQHGQFSWTRSNEQK